MARLRSNSQSRANYHCQRHYAHAESLNFKV